MNKVYVLMDGSRVVGYAKENKLADVMAWAEQGIGRHYILVEEYT